MLWAIYCIDKPNCAEIRAKHMEAHRKYLDENASRMFFSGPLQSDDAKDITGSLWVVNAKDRADAQAFAEGESLFKAGLFESVIIRRMRKGFFDETLVDG